MFDKKENQTDENQQQQNPVPFQSSKNFEKRIEELDQKGNKSGKRKGIYLIIGIIFLVSIVAGGYYFWDDVVNFLNPTEETKKVDCATDTKECPDGSFVNRIQPNCEFAECLAFKSNQDTDNDGLLDGDEEKYGCDLNNPDSDGDGYLDGDEVKNGYNPMGEEPLQDQVEDDFWKIYKGDEFEIKYPQEWEVKTDSFEFDEGIKSLQVQFFSQLKNNSDDFQERFLVDVSISDDMTDMDELKKFHDSLIQDNILELFNTTLDNKPAYGNISIIDDMDGITVKTMSVYTIINNKFYMIQYFVNALDDSSEFKDFVETAEEMIESFKLIN